MTLNPIVEIEEDDDDSRISDSRLRFCGNAGWHDAPTAAFTLPSFCNSGSFSANCHNLISNLFHLTLTFEILS